MFAVMFSFPDCVHKCVCVFKLIFNTEKERETVRTSGTYTSLNTVDFYTFSRILRFME